MRRAFQSLALLALLLDPLAFVARAAAADAHDCNDHVCLCSSRCPPRRTAGDHCQGAPKSAAAVRGACRHDKTTVLPSATLAVLAAAAPVPPTTARDSVEPSPERRPPSGFARPEPHPPRAL